MTTFHVAGAVAVAATLMAVTRRHAVHALLYLIVSLLSVAIIFYLLGAPFVAALEGIVYAGAILVLYLFVVMLLGVDAQEMTRSLRHWLGPAALAAVLLGELLYLSTSADREVAALQPIAPHQLGLSLFGPYLLGVELASVLLLAAAVGAFHLARRSRR